MSNLKAIAVIGANYGDEGKGLITDALTEKHSSGTVVRFNGGSQASHTVTTPDGFHHAFSHFGAGSAAGADTYLSKHFICNPSMFVAERKVLEEKGLSNLNVFVHKDALVTTPWDEVINQFLELGRGRAAHGSVGVGIGETVERSEVGRIPLRAGDLMDLSKLTGILRKIAVDWFPFRLKQLRAKGEFSCLSGEQLAVLANYAREPRHMASRFLHSAFDFLIKINLVNKGVFKNPEAPIIFEGAQGLMLDQDSGQFPHVTRSNTGVKNIMDICQEECIHLEEVIFATRTYLTRHGAGPLPKEGKWTGGIEDLTNVPNKYQGAIRTAPLNWGDLFERVTKETRRLPHTAKWSLAITHCDLMKFPYVMDWGNEVKHVDMADFEAEVKMGWDSTYLSFGPTRDTLSCLNHQD